MSDTETSDTPSADADRGGCGSEPAPAATLWDHLRVLLIIPVNGFFALARAGFGSDEEPSGGYILGFVLMLTFVGPLVIVAICHWDEGTRNRKSRLKIFFWTSLILLIGSVAELGKTPVEP